MCLQGHLNPTSWRMWWPVRHQVSLKTGTGGTKMNGDASVGPASTQQAARAEAVNMVLNEEQLGRVAEEVNELN